MRETATATLTRRHRLLVRIGDFQSPEESSILSGAIMNDVRLSIIRLLEGVLDEQFEVCWCDDPWCQFQPPKLHLIDKGSWDYVAQVALHEVTHLMLGRGGHDISFWERFEQLLSDHLKSSLNEHQSKMKYDYVGS